MKDSIQAHNDYAENVLPKLKRAYLKKCQDVEVRASRFLPRVVVRSRSTNPQDHKSVALSAASQAKSDLRHPDVQGQYYRDPATRPVVTSPQPLRPLERRASTNTPTTRSRSPPSTLSDIASQGQLHPVHSPLTLTVPSRQKAAESTHDIFGQGDREGGP